MTFALIGALIGAFLGFTNARRAKGNRLDILQYVVIFAMAGGLIGFILAIILVRST